MTDDEVLMITMGASAAALAIMLVIAQAVNFSPLGSFGSMMIATIVFFCVGMAILGSTVAIIWTGVAMIRKQKESATPKLLGIWIAIFLGLTGSLFVCQQIRQTAVDRIIKKGAPLIVAIAHFEEKYHRPPGRLESLVPEFAPGLPDTELGFQPSFRYHPDSKSPGWTMTVQLSMMPGISEELTYRSSKNYPDSLGNAGVERIGDWAVVYQML